MKYIIGSDIHGSKSYLSKFLKFKEINKIDKILLLGDLFYSGARNIPPSDYNPKEVVSILNNNSSDIIAVKGNCESDIDLKVTNFYIGEIVSLNICNKKIALFHGHIDYFDKLSETNDIIFSGHTHISELKKINSTIYANPGSISLPKDNNHSFMVLSNNLIELIDLENNNILKSIKI